MFSWGTSGMMLLVEDVYFFAHQGGQGDVASTHGHPSSLLGQ